MPLVYYCQAYLYMIQLQLIGELARRALKTSITLAGGKADA